MRRKPFSYKGSEGPGDGEEKLSLSLWQREGAGTQSIVYAFTDCSSTALGYPWGPKVTCLWEGTLEGWALQERKKENLEGREKQELGKRRNMQQKQSTEEMERDMGVGNPAVACVVS